MVELNFAFAFIFLLTVVNIGLCEVIQLSCQDIATLVDGHNNRRQLVASGKVRGQPAASNMKYIKWDEELAEKAEAWVANGVIQHNPDREVASDRFSTGENLYATWSTVHNSNINLDDGLNSWFKEHFYYKFGPMTMKDFNRGYDRQIGHYTQMVWADTEYVGCGLSKTQDYRDTTFLLICNYGPSGNYVGQEPYKIGKQGSRLIGNKTQLYGPNCKK